MEGQAKALLRLHCAETELYSYIHAVNNLGYANCLVGQSHPSNQPPLVATSAGSPGITAGSYAFHDASRTQARAPETPRVRPCDPMAETPAVSALTDAADQAQPAVVPGAKEEPAPEPARRPALTEREASPPTSQPQPARGPDLVRLEQAVARGDWQQVAEQTAEDLGRTPLKTLLHVIALRETARGRDANDVTLTHDAIAALSSLLGVAENSPTALILAKRLLRRNPFSRTRQPSAALSASVMLVGIGAGGAIGWLATKLLL